jgi:hypothetical protein
MSQFSGVLREKLKKLEFNFVFFITGGFNVQVLMGLSWRSFLKAGDLASLLHLIKTFWKIQFFIMYAISK